MTLRLSRPDFEGPHPMPAQDGWEEIADYALQRSVEHARIPEAA